LEQLKQAWKRYLFLGINKNILLHTIIRKTIQKQGIKKGHKAIGFLS
jgi:hypothetical protein